MKKFLKVMWILAACMAGLGVLITMWGFTWTMRVADRLTPEKSVPMRFPMDMLTVDEIHIDLGVGDVQFMVDDEARIEATGFTGEDLVIVQEGSAIRIKGRDPLGGSHILNLGIFRIDWLGRVHMGTLEKRMVTVYLPKRTGLEALAVETGVGDVTGKLIGSMGNASFSSGTGDLRLEDFFCESLVCDYGTGDIALENISVETEARISTTTGDLMLTDCDWNDLAFDGNTGKLILRNCTAEGSASFNHGTDDLKIAGGSWNDLQVDMTTGDLEFDGHLTGDCRMTTTTGSVTLHLDETCETYSAALETGTGDVRVENAPITLLDKKEYAVNPDASVANRIKIDVSTGDIVLVFAEE